MILLRIFILIFSTYLIYDIFNDYDNHEVEKLMIKYEKDFDYSKYTKDEIRRALKHTFMRSMRRVTAREFFKTPKEDNLSREISVIVPDEIKKEKSVISTQSVDCKTYSARTGMKVEKVTIKGNKYQNIKNFQDMNNENISDIDNSKNMSKKDILNHEGNPISDFESIKEFKENSLDIIDYHDKNYSDDKDDSDPIKSEESIIKKLFKNKKNNLN